VGGRRLSSVTILNETIPTRRRDGENDGEWQRGWEKAGVLLAAFAKKVPKERMVYNRLQRVSRSCDFSDVVVSMRRGMEKVPASFAGSMAMFEISRHTDTGFNARYKSSWTSSGLVLQFTSMSFQRLSVDFEHFDQFFADFGHFAPFALCNGSCFCDVPPS
jgi:hypothetical protein